MEAKQGNVVDRAEVEYDRDRMMADDALAAADAHALHSMCQRLNSDRVRLAQGFVAMLDGMSVLKKDIPRLGPSAEHDAIAAVERIAKESIDFAREIFRLLYQPPKA